MDRALHPQHSTPNKIQGAGCLNWELWFRFTKHVRDNRIFPYLREGRQSGKSHSTHAEGRLDPPGGPAPLSSRRVFAMPRVDPSVVQSQRINSSNYLILVVMEY